MDSGSNATQSRGKQYLLVALGILGWLIYVGIDSKSSHDTNDVPQLPETAAFQSIAGHLRAQSRYPFDIAASAALSQMNRTPQRGEAK